MKSYILLHIPKTAGRSFSQIVRRQFKKIDTYEIDNSNVTESISDFKNLHSSQKENIRCLIGHMRFGLHKYLKQPCGYLTFVRDPIDRIISHYYYVLQTPNHYLYNKVISNKMSLEDYISSDVSMELKNNQTHVIAGIPNSDEKVCGDELLNIAKENIIRHFVFVGLTEFFDLSILMLKNKLQWRNVFYTRQNVTMKRPKSSQVSNNVISKIKERNEKDIKLYQFAKDMFIKSLEEVNVNFFLEVERFRKYNKLYNTINNGYKKIWPF